MQLVFHTGAHFTEEERLMKCLLRNQDKLRERGVAVPGPGKYRKLLRQTVVAMSESEAAADARDVVLDAILDDNRAERVLLSNAHFFGAPRAALRKGLIYPNAPERVANLVRLFDTDEVELFMAIRNPATFLPACFAKSPREDTADFMGGVDPRAVRWSDTFVRIREAAPNVPITVWCNEDAPFLWSQMMREMGGMDHGEPVVGGFDLFGDIISEEGMKRFVSYIKSKPSLTEMQVRRIMVAFLDKFALDEAIEEEIDMPGWTAELIDEMTESYEDDLATIERIPGVTVLTP